MEKQTSFKPPKAAQNNARRGLELRRRFNRGGLSTREAGKQGIGSGVSRASTLANGKNVSMKTVRDMARFFSRHSKNNRPSKRESDGGPTAGTIAWLLWGGSAGQRWAEGIVRRADEAQKCMDVEIAKVDSRLGVVFGYAIVCKVDGEEYFDLQGDHIPEDTMLEATSEFMSGFRVAKDMHRGDAVGQVLFGFPMTTDIAKALDVEIAKSGFIVGMKPDNDEMLEKYESGEYTGFSIGGRRVLQEDVD